MRHLPFILFCLLLLVSCDIPKTLSLRNKLNKPIKISVSEETAEKYCYFLKSTPCIDKKNTFVLCGGFGAFWKKTDKADLQSILTNSCVYDCDSSRKNISLTNYKIIIRGGRKHVKIIIKKKNSLASGYRLRQ
jgi:hypothetical protein